MSTSADELQMSSEFIIEVRYQARPKVLDYRGVLTSVMTTAFKVNHWRISENRVEVSDIEKTDEASVIAFVSHRNMGIVIRNQIELSTIQKYAPLLIRNVFAEKAFQPLPVIERIGVRIRAGKAYRGSFTELLNLFRSKLINLSQPAATIFEQAGLTIADMGSPLTLTTNNGTVKANGGPMLRDQLAENFPFNPVENLPEVSLYLDIDHYVTPKAELDAGAVTSELHASTKFILDVQNKLAQLVTE